MLRMKIELTINAGQGESLHHMALEASKALARAIFNASHEKPAHGGQLCDSNGKSVGTYLVNFNA